MATGLEKTGIEFVSKGEAAFQKNINLGAKALEGFNKVAAIGGNILSTFAKAIGNVAQIAGGILVRDVLRGIFKGVADIAKEAADEIFGSADAIKKLKDNAAKAAADLPDLRTELGLAKLKMFEMSKSSEASATDLANQAVAVRKLEAELTEANATIKTAAIEQHKYNESLAGQFSAFRGSLVDIAKTALGQFLPTLTNAFQRLSPIVLNLAKQFGNFVANPVFIAKAQELVDWLSTTLPVALNNVRKAIQPVIDIFAGGGSWTDKLKLLGQSILDWFEGMIPQIGGQLDLWNRTFTAWIIGQANVISQKIQTEWGPRFVAWINSPETQRKAGELIGQFVAWSLDQFMKFSSAIVQSISTIFTSLWQNVLSPTEGGKVVTGFLGGFWDAFSKSQVFKQIKYNLEFTWSLIRGAAKNAWVDIAQSIEIILTQVSVIIANIWYKITDGLRNGWLDLRDHARAIWGKVKDTLTEIWNTVATVAKKVWGDIHFAVLSSYYDIENKLKLAWSLFAGEVQRAWDKITAPIMKVWTTVHDFITDPVKRQEMIDGAKAWIQGFVDGLKQKAYDLYNTVRDIFNKVIQTIKGILGIASPSKLGIALGANFGAAFGLGMKDALEGVALNAFAQVSPPSMTGGGASSYSYSNSTSYAPSLTIHSPAPANVQQSFALLGAMVGGPVF